ncbi:MAG: HspR, transcriptional repressor of DnaK operon [uncultured Thermomicrobiales bacterium]|uniref:HspR, transcriptional repressor of DnaK operon n=1 Tax=uncultured Thermomicrobiales bacterium TaxID=1645740 RepID=A0A6J4V1N6_9BACT|nr:MAG: HspR, transcriptional repressor of DnaK operon [uncultured Thermomicrobiales bacterium]
MGPRHGEPLFVISVAARLVEMHPQTLRKYEREGLIAPSRTSGNLRLYSDRDIERLRQVKYLVEERGLNLAGVQLALELTRRLRERRSRLGQTLAGVGPDGETPLTTNDLVESVAETWNDIELVLAHLGHIDQNPAPPSRTRG